jgi:hypothetical protein
MSTRKTGLEYFPLDVDFFEDEKIEFVAAKYGIKGENIAVKLLCRIYRNGYYLDWGEDEALLFSKRSGDGITPELVMDVINELVKRRFFSEKHFKKYQILTSNGIQNRYLEATRRRKEVLMCKEYLIADINGFNVNISALNDDISPQSKVKESKVKESNKDRHFEFVFLKKEEYEKLCKEFGKETIESKIEDLDNYIGQNPKARVKKYQDHNRTIRAWLKRDGILPEARKMEMRRIECPHCHQQFSTKEIKAGCCPACGYQLQKT